MAARVSSSVGAVAGVLLGAVGMAGCPPDAPPMSGVVELSVGGTARGGQRFCVRTREGRVACWAGPKVRGGRMSPHGIALYDEPRDVVGVAVGEDHVCAAIADGTVRCWGEAPNWETGGGSHRRPVEGVAGAVAVAVGLDHSCALLRSGAVACWGSNGRHQLGDNLSANRRQARPVLGVATARAIAAGDAHTCAVLTDGRVACWGANDHGQAGHASGRDQPIANVIPGLDGVVEVAAGSRHTCARRTDGTIWCWGSNARGQLGDASRCEHEAHEDYEDHDDLRSVGRDPTVAARAPEARRAHGPASPTPVAASTRAVAVAAHGDRSCALLEDGTVRCWGHLPGPHGGVYHPCAVGVAPPEWEPMVALEVGPREICGIDSRTRVTCWGPRGSYRVLW